MNPNKKAAFTLAEVLITLGIIGVVAAMTIPTLISNYQKKQWVAGLQKGYAVLSNTLKMAMADDMVGSLNQTTLWKSLPDEDNMNDADGMHTQFISVLTRFLKINKYCESVNAGGDAACFQNRYKLLDGKDEAFGDYFTKKNRLKVYTADGLVYYFRLFKGKIYDNHDNVKYLAGHIEIDVNGDSGPNQHGRDLFEVIVLDNGKLVFPGSKEWQDLSGDGLGGQHWGDAVGSSICNPNNESFPSGDYCGARVFEQGWRMDY